MMKKHNSGGINRIIALLVLFTLFSCGSMKRESTEQKLDNSQNNPTVEVSGKALYTTVYCGGARPTPEIQRMHATPRSIKNASLLFRKYGTDDAMKTFAKTDSLGRFTAKLPPGKWEYSIAEDFYNHNNEAGMEFPRECDKFYGIPYGTVQLSADTAGLELRFRLRCNPCDPSIYMRP
jgi:hypothetical protein